MNIEVWVSTKTETDPTKYRNVLALMDPHNLDFSEHKQSELPGSGRMDSCSPDKLKKENLSNLIERGFTYDPYAGIISLHSQPQDDQAVAVYYSYKIYKNVSVNRAQRQKDSTIDLVLKLVRPSVLNYAIIPAWTMMLKNRYFLGGTAIDKSSFTFNISYQLPGQTPVTDITTYNVGVMEMLGLDRYSSDNTAKPDKVFDYIPGITINEKRGEIIFPTVEPFNSSSMYKYFMNMAALIQPRLVLYGDSFAFDAIYNEDVQLAVYDPHNLYLYERHGESRTKASYSLGFNIVEGSVQVIVDGQPAIQCRLHGRLYLRARLLSRIKRFLLPGVTYKSSSRQTICSSLLQNRCLARALNLI